MARKPSSDRRSVGFADDTASTSPQTDPSDKTFTMPSDAELLETATTKLSKDSVRKSLRKQFPDFDSNPKTQQKILARFVSDAKKKAQKEAAKAGSSEATSNADSQVASTSLKDVATTPTKRKSSRKGTVSSTKESDASARFERNKKRGEPKLDVFADTPSGTSASGGASLALSLEDLFSHDRPEGSTFSIPNGPTVTVTSTRSTPADQNSLPEYNSWTSRSAFSQGFGSSAGFPIQNRWPGANSGPSLSGFGASTNVFPWFTPWQGSGGLADGASGWAPTPQQTDITYQSQSNQPGAFGRSSWGRSTPGFVPFGGRTQTGSNFGNDNAPVDIDPHWARMKAG